MSNYETEIRHALKTFESEGFTVASVAHAEAHGKIVVKNIDEAIDHILSVGFTWVNFTKNNKYIASGLAILGNGPGELFADWSYPVYSSDWPELDALSRKVSDDFVWVTT